MANLTKCALAPFTLKGFYLLSWGTALGTNVWQVISSYKASTALPKESFTQLQSTTQPAYFATSSLLTSTLLLSHLYFHPVLLSSPLNPPHWWQVEEGVQGILVVAGLLPNLVNWLVVSPKIRNLIYSRHRLERSEGKTSTVEPSVAMARLDGQFSALHNVSVALNTVSLIALAGLGLAVSM